MDDKNMLESRDRFLKLRKYTGLTQAEFASKYNIPKRTVENWEAVSDSARRNAPTYVLDLLERVVKEDFPDPKV